MSISLYDASIPVFIRSLGSMAKFLEKGPRLCRREWASRTPN